MHHEIVPGSAVTLHFSLSLEDGTEAISTFDEEPLSFNVGDRTFQPGLEICLYGLKSGDEQTITLNPMQAYGEHEAALVQQMPITDFDADNLPQVDQVMSFLLADTEETMGIIREINDTEVTVDFNHPLAGHNVVFKVQILEVGIPDLSVLEKNKDDDEA